MPVKLTLTYPDTAQLRNSFGVTQPNNLRIYTKATPSASVWNTVTVDTINIAARQIMARVTHFSVYRLGAVIEATPPFTSRHTPARDAENVEDLTPNIQFHLEDVTAGVDSSSVQLFIKGVSVTPDSLTGTLNDYLVSYQPPTPFSPNDTVSVRIVAGDLAGAPNTLDETYRFVTGLGRPRITIPSEVAAVARQGADLSVGIRINDSDGIEEANLNYRQGGQIAWAPLQMAPVGNDSFQVDIPGAIVTHRGLELFIQATDSTGVTAISDTLEKQVTVDSLVSTDLEIPAGQRGDATSEEFQAQEKSQFRMFSVPVGLTGSRTPNAVFGRSGVAVSDTTLRLFRWNGANYTESVGNWIRGKRSG